MRHQKGGKDACRSEEKVDVDGKRKREGRNTQVNSMASEKVHTHDVPLITVDCCVKLRKIPGRLRYELQNSRLNQSINEKNVQPDQPAQTGIVTQAKTNSWVQPRGKSHCSNPYRCTHRCIDQPELAV